MNLCERERAQLGNLGRHVRIPTHPPLAFSSFRPVTLPAPVPTVLCSVTMAARTKNQNQPQYEGLPDIHMNTAKGLTMSVPDIRMATAKGMTMDKDIRMDTAKPGTTLKQTGFKMWEKELIDSPEVRRKATVAQLCESAASVIRIDLPRTLSAYHLFLYGNCGSGSLPADGTRLPRLLLSSHMRRKRDSLCGRAHGS